MPFAVVVQFQHDPQKMCAVLHNRYATVSTFSLARLKYAGEGMNKYLSKLEKCSAQLAAMGSPLEESLLIIMFLNCLGHGITQCLAVQYPRC